MFHPGRATRPLLGLLLLFAAGTLSAQVAGTLSGTVVDQTGAAVPNASIRVFLAGGKDPLLTGTTNTAGLFRFIAVRPETYDVAVESKGFTPLWVRGVKVAPIQEVSLGSLTIEVASAAQMLEVAATVQAVQLSNPEIASTITASQVQNLPVLGRQVTTLFQTQPGVSSGSNPTTVNGLRVSMVNVTLDGINIQDNFIRTNALDYAPMRTTIDQISEITISTSNQGASLGGGAAQMVISTKSGTNDFHGAVYWYNRNSALAANNWFNNQSGIARPQLNLNQPGASLGGPIVKDKLFFYVNYELYRERQQSSRLRTVLTDSAKRGIFTYRAGGETRTANLLAMRNIAINPAIQSMINDVPSPNSTGAGDGLNTGAYRFNARDNEYRDQFVYRGDYYLTSAQSISGTYNYIDNPTDRPDLGTFYSAVPPVRNSIKNHLLSLAWRWTASPTLTNEVRGGFARTNGLFVVSNEYPSYTLSTTNLLFTSPVNTYMNQGRETNTYQIQDNANWLKGKHQIAFGFQSQMLRVAPYNDAGILPQYTVGISANNRTGFAPADFPGVSSGDLVTANNLYANLGGIISSATQTFNVTSATSGFVPGATNLRNLTHDSYALYIQDNWKVRPNLTLNLGLRYEYWTPLDEKSSLYLAARYENNDLRASLLNPNAVLEFIGKSAGRPFYNADKNNFSPNIGFAWDPFGAGKTSIRGGYMLAFANDNVVTTIRNNVNTSSGLQATRDRTGLTDTLAAPPALPAPEFKVPRTLADNYALDPNSAVGLPDPNIVTPYVQQWNFSLERHMFQESFPILVAARYIGNRSSQLLRAYDLNQIDINRHGFFADFRRAQSNLVLAERAGMRSDGSYNASVPGSQPLTVFPQLASGGLLNNATVVQLLRQGQVGELANIYMTNRLNGPLSFYENRNVLGANTVSNTGWANYHGLQLEVFKRVRNDLQFQFSYVYSKTLSNTTGDGQTNFEPLLDNANESLEVAPSPFDLRQVYKLNYLYELPFGRGKRWSGNKLANATLGGWSVSGIWSYQSGAPFSILSGWGTLNRGARSVGSNTASVNGTTGDELKELVGGGVFMTGRGPYFVAPSIIDANGRGASPAGTAPFAGQKFFNPDAGTVGNLQRRMFYGPWQFGWDAGVQKQFRFLERHSVTLHADAFNVLNKATFNVPTNSGDSPSRTNFTINNTTFGRITGMFYSQRRLQFGLYYRF